MRFDMTYSTQESSKHQKVNTMTRTNIIALCICALAVSGCNLAQDEVRHVQTNVVDKSIFEGEWWFSQTVVDVDADAAALGFVFNGQMSGGDEGINIYGRGGFQGTFSVARIRWVIGPICPSPLWRPSMSPTGVCAPKVPVRNASSAP